MRFHGLNLELFILQVIKRFINIYCFEIHGRARTFTTSRTQLLSVLLFNYVHVSCMIIRRPVSHVPCYYTKVDQMKFVVLPSSNLDSSLKKSKSYVSSNRFIPLSMVDNHRRAQTLPAGEAP
jgi:hypothetical protein